MQNKLDHKVQRYYRLAVLMHCGINTIYAMYAMYLLSRGLNILQLCLVHAVFYGMLAVLELPTGAIADLYGRMTAVAISCLVFIVCMVTFAYTDTIAGFVAAAALRAVAQTFANGASDSWIREALRQNGDTDDKSRDVFFRAEVRKHSWGIAAAGGGAVLVDLFGMSAAWILGIVFYLGALGIALRSVPEENSERKVAKGRAGRETMITTCQAGIRYARSSTSICFLMLAAAGFHFAIATPNILWQPFFAERMPQWFQYQSGFGVLWGVAMGTHLLGIWIASKIGPVSEARKVLLVCGFIAAIGMVGTAFFGPPLLMLVYLIHQGARGPFDPWRRTYLHNNINKPEAEATIASFVSVVQHASAAVGLVTTGLVAKYGSMGWSWAVSGAVLLVVVLFLWRRRNSN